jgi:hypothetical protein
MAHRKNAAGHDIAPSPSPWCVTCYLSQRSLGFSINAGRRTIRRSGKALENPATISAFNSSMLSSPRYCFTNGHPPPLSGRNA